jgi:uncharacterized membrane protein YkvA (DUF1232 family)
MQSLKQKLKKFKRETYAIYLASKHPDVPWYARALAVCIAAYAFSPIDLIPDVIPIIGFLDDLILVPLGILLVTRMIPPDVLAECRQKSEEAMREKHTKNWIMAAVIISIWVILGGLMAVWLSKLLQRS